MENIKFVGNLLLSLLFPLRCIACRERIKGGALCSACRAKIIIHRGFLCPTCRRHLPEPYSSCHPKNSFLLSAATSFQQPEVRELVHSLKYAGLKSAAEEMAGLMEMGLGNSLLELLNPQITLIVPAPLHFQKLQQRGFNQSDLLAIKIAEKMGPKWQIKRILKRIQNNKSQTECKNKKERFKNVSGIFEVTEKLAGPDIVLIDDVFTSGATMQEMMRTLKAAGAGRLIAIVFAEA